MWPGSNGIAVPRTARSRGRIGNCQKHPAPFCGAKSWIASERWRPAGVKASWPMSGCQTHGPGAQCALGHHEATCLLIPIILAFALMFPDLDPPPKFKAWVENNEVWMETSTGPRRVAFE